MQNANPEDLNKNVWQQFDKNYANLDKLFWTIASCKINTDNIDSKNLANRNLATFAVNK